METSKELLTRLDAVNATKHHIVLMYLDYVNNFISTRRFAEHYGVSEQLASLIINEGSSLYKTDK